MILSFATMFFMLVSMGIIFRKDLHLIFDSKSKSSNN